MKAPSTTAVCTLFEGHYHYGVAALVNSLYKQGYRGSIYAGYRGSLPKWADQAHVLHGEGEMTLAVAGDLCIHFILLDTDYHLTNYKPDFMLRVWDGPARHASNIYYFDPDIVVTAPWNFFDHWVEYGVALCEDVNSPLPRNHPRRAAWRKYYGEKGIALSFKTTTYANGGYVGLSKRDKSFLVMWRTLQEEMAHAIGGLKRSALNGKPLLPEMQGPFSPFGKTDQDALNATIEAWDGDVSFVGQEGMSLKSGAPLMPHALGHPKPWMSNPLTEAINGRPPRLVDREYWKNASGVIVAHKAAEIQKKLFTIKLAALIGRFYQRG
ncbi:MAG TPA: hypothetical protein VFT90_04420 [Chryseosolibacter sp.]|nr:hypothetical protein [Chryseosolibacter sp.]